MEKGILNKIKRVPWLRIVRYSITIFFLTTVLSVVILRWIPVPFSAVMLQDKLSAVIKGEELEIHHSWVTFEKISKKIMITVIAAEDQKFPDHWGFDVEQITDALEDSERGKRLRGASTISQQTAKNLFCWKGRSFIRKGFEAYFTVLIELFWSKERILEVYLNIIELGKGVYGVEAASEIYFKKHASQLNLNEAALLTTTLPNPLRRSVKAPSAYMIRRTSAIIKQVNLLGGESYLKRLE